MHVCADKSLFVSYQAIHGRSVTMGNGTASRVLGIGRVDLRLPSGRVLSLSRVHHVPAVWRNILSGSVLVEQGYKITFKCNKVVLIYLGTFIRKGYLSDGLFKLHVDNVLNKDVVDISSSSTSYSVNIMESSNLWRNRLGHVNYNSLKRMMNLNMIPEYTIDKTAKCDICV